MTRHRQNDPELMEHLYEQMAFLRRSASHYDDGEFSEANASSYNSPGPPTRFTYANIAPHTIRPQEEAPFRGHLGDVAPNTFERLLGGRFRASIAIATPLAPMRVGLLGLEVHRAS